MKSPTVDVDIPGIVSVETERPLDNVEVVVTGSEYLGVLMGVAKDRERGRMALYSCQQYVC